MLDRPRLTRHRLEQLHADCMEQLITARVFNLREWVEAFRRRLYWLEEKLAALDGKRGTA